MQSRLPLAVSEKLAMLKIRICGGGKCGQCGDITSTDVSPPSPPSVVGAPGTPPAFVRVGTLPVFPGVNVIVGGTCILKSLLSGSLKRGFGVYVNRPAVPTGGLPSKGCRTISAS